MAREIFRHILVATDGSALASRAVDDAVALAACHDSQLVALTVVPRYPTSFFEGAATFSPDEVARVERRWADGARTILEGALARAIASGVCMKTVTASSDHIAESIIAASIKHGSDLIVMGSHGRAGIKRLLLGSEVQHVLTHSTVPVLVLR